MKIDVHHVATLANLPLNEEEKKRLEKELEETVTYVEKLNEIDTKGIQPTNQVTGLENVSDQDTARPSLSQEDALKNTKSTHNGFFKVKAILDNE